MWLLLVHNCPLPVLPLKRCIRPLLDHLLLLKIGSDWRAVSGLWALSTANGSGVVAVVVTVFPSTYSVLMWLLHGFHELPISAYIEGSFHVVPDFVGSAVVIVVYYFSGVPTALAGHAFLLRTHPFRSTISGSRKPNPECFVLFSHRKWVRWGGAVRGTISGLAGAALFAVLAAVYLLKRPRPVYLVDFACYKPGDELKISNEGFLEMTESTGSFSEENLDFQTWITGRSGLGDETYLPSGIQARPPNLSMAEARMEAESVMFGVLDALFKKTGVDLAEIGILVVNCSLFNPTPSLASMIVNHYKMRADIKSFNLRGMGCSAGLISIDLARHLLQANPSSFALVVSMENITLNWYFGNDRSMLLPNYIFRMGGGAALLSNRGADRQRSKYSLVQMGLVNSTNVLRFRSSSSMCQNSEVFLLVAMATKPHPAAGVKAWNPGGVTRWTGEPRVPSPMLALKTLHHPSSHFLWKNRVDSSAQVGQPPWSTTFFLPDPSRVRNT
ncbi:hypothetical protein Taro_041349 [Colocasia esculenta]|uniref:FAE domain-containing protein n=1 Tax=Colocasia esculenta TaxID=4460 RepID=A0A843WE50_COLES|nr:hypothetical protein [Colocasia esculenta]